MTIPPRSRYGASAWAVGALVLTGLSAAVTWMVFSIDDFSANGASITRSKTVAPTVVELAAAPDQASTSADPREQVAIRGVVRLPSGDPAPGATVTLQRLLTTWPEWRMNAVETAITDEAGGFQFGVPHRYGYLLEFESPAHAGGLRQVGAVDQELELRLRPGYSVFGNVLNDVGAPVPNARVSIESVQRGNRRAASVYTAADGSYRFKNVAAGVARMVARHESWQPVAANSILIGDRRDVEFRFERPTMAPLRGVVLRAEDGAPVAGASIELVPINQNLGLVDPIATTSAADGVFLLEGLPRLSMQMWVRHPDYGTVSRTQAIGAAASEISVELPNRTRAVGEVYSRTAGVVLGGEVLQLRDSGGEVAYAAVDSEGGFEFDRPVSPGFVDISCVGGALSFRTVNGAAYSVRLNEGDQNFVRVEVLAAPVVSGRVVDSAGAPVSGVNLFRTQSLGDNVRTLGDAAMSLDLLRVGNSLVHLTDRDELLAVSGADGAFALRGSKAGRMLVRAEGAGHGSRLLRLQIPAFGAVRDLGEVVLQPGCQISGVVLRGGRSFVGATVSVKPLGSEWRALAGDAAPLELRRGDGGRSATSLSVSGADGAYVIDGLEAGSYEVRARNPGRNARGAARVVTVSAARPVQDADITIQAGRVLRGFVKNELGQPLVDALVSVRGRPGEVSRSRSDGAFVVELPRRRAELIVSLGDRSLERVVGVERDEQELEVRLDAPPTCAIAGVVLGVPDRRLLPGVLMRTTAVGAATGADSLSRWVPTPDGELNRSQVPSGRVRLEFWCDGYAPLVLERDLLANQVNQLGDLVLERGSRLRGLVLDEAGEPVADALVLLGRESDFDLFDPAVRSAADGSFVIDGVTSGSRQLVVNHPAFATRTLGLQLPRDVLGLKPLPVVLERGNTIEVVVPISEIPDNGLIFLRRDGRLVMSTVLDDRGYAWFSNRSAGSYSVKLAGKQGQERRVVVKSGAKVTRLLF